MMQGDRPVGPRYPIGVIVVIIVTILRCVSITAGLVNLQGNGIADWLRVTSPLPEFPPGSDQEIVAGVLLGGLLVASIIVIIGLLAQRQWAWVLAIVSSGIILAIDLGWWYSGDPRFGSMFLNVIAVFYLNQRDVRIALRGEAST
jgi:uncharacterized membrane protein YphA (DoxX/SURF4 family)